MIPAGPSRSYAENENLTLSDSDLAAVGAPRRAGGKLRAFCPVHGSDHQRSLEVNLETGRFSCFSCAAWGYMDWSREDFARERGLDRERPSGSRRSPVQRPAPPPPKPIEPVRDDLDALMGRFRDALPGSWGAAYLRHRGIPLQTAIAAGVGYAPPGDWPGRGWKGGRLVAAHTRPDGEIVNLYGRAVARGDVPKNLRHDHLGGNKGYFHARALAGGEGPLYVVEGLLDALAMMASGRGRTVAIFSARDWRWSWVGEEVGRSGMVLALDSDETGEEAREKLAGEARLRGVRVAFLDGDSYGAEKDPAAAFAAGTLEIGEWPAEPPRPEKPEPSEKWNRERAGAVPSEILAGFARRVAEAGLDHAAVDTDAFDAAFGDMYASEERGDLVGFEEAARCARGAASEAVERALRAVENPGPADCGPEASGAVAEPLAAFLDAPPPWWRTQARTVIAGGSLAGHVAALARTTAGADGVFGDHRRDEEALPAVRRKLREMAQGDPL